MNLLDLFLDGPDYHARWEQHQANEGCDPEGLCASHWAAIREAAQALADAEQRGAESAKAEAQPAGTGWVSVEERLPEQRECVLLWSKSGKFAADHYRLGYWDCEPDSDASWCDDQSWFGDVGDLALVTHWQPLPPPPEPR